MAAVTNRRGIESESVDDVVCVIVGKHDPRLADFDSDSPLSLHSFSLPFGGGQGQMNPCRLRSASRCLIARWSPGVPDPITISFVGSGGLNLGWPFLVLVTSQPCSR